MGVAFPSLTVAELYAASYDTVNWTYVVSNDQLDIDAAEYTRTATSYAKQTEFTVPSTCAGNFRLKFQIKAEGGNTAYAKIYKNGVVEAGVNTTVETTYQDKEQEITGVAAGDTIELWTKSSVNGSYVKVQNFSINGASTYNGAKTEPTW